jgi:hypothetical protein
LKENAEKGVALLAQRLQTALDKQAPSFWLKNLPYVGAKPDENGRERQYFPRNITPSSPDQQYGVKVSNVKKLWSDFLVPIFEDVSQAHPELVTNVGYLSFTYGRIFLNVVNPFVGSYESADHSASLKKGQLIVKYGLSNIHRYSVTIHPGKAIKNDNSRYQYTFVNSNPASYDLYARPFYQDARNLLNDGTSEAFLEFESGKGDPRRVLGKRWKFGYIFASIEGL